MKKQDKNKLRLWQDRLKTNEAAYDGETSRMDEREALYAGTNEMRPIVQGERKTKAVHVRNICAEIIEAHHSPARSHTRRVSSTPIRSRWARSPATSGWSDDSSQR